MALVTINGYPVCFTSKRVDGRRVSVYRGCGMSAYLFEILWREDVEERAEIRRLERDAIRQSVEPVERLDRELRSLYLHARQAIIDKAGELGFVYHRSCEFRRCRRSERNEMNELTRNYPDSRRLTPAPSVGTVIERREFCFGDSRRFPSLAAFDDVRFRAVDPEFFERARGHLFKLSVTTIADFASNVLSEPAVDEKISATLIQAVELAGENPNPATRLAAEAAAICWLEATTLEAIHLSQAAAMHFHESELGRIIPEAARRKVDRVARLADRAFKRFAQSLKLLTDIQRATARVSVRTVTRSNAHETLTASQVDIEP